MTKISNIAKQKADLLYTEGFSQGSSLISYIEDEYSAESIHASFMAVLPEATEHISVAAGMIETSKMLREECGKTNEDTEFPGKLHFIYILETLKKVNKFFKRNYYQVFTLDPRWTQKI